MCQVWEEKVLDLGTDINCMSGKLSEDEFDKEYKKLMDVLMEQQPRIITMIHLTGDILIDIYQNEEEHRGDVLQAVQEIIAHTIGLQDEPPTYIQ